MSKKPKIGYALGVGGARGFCHIGVLSALEEHGIKPDFIAGASMGSLVGGLYALGLSVSEIEQSLMKMERRDILDISILFSIVKGGIARDKKFVNRIVEIAADKEISDCKIPFKAVAADLVTGEEYIFDSGVIWQAIRASSSIPGVFHPVEMDGKVLVDGGLLCRVPAGTARQMGADIVIGVDALGDHSDSFKPSSAISVLRRAFEVADKRIFGRVRNESDILISPDNGNRDALDFRTRSKQAAIESGRLAALAAMDEIKKLINR